jgi:hypothetical protein
VTVAEKRNIHMPYVETCHPRLVVQVRVEFHGADGDDNETLYEAMEGEGFARRSDGPTAFRASACEQVRRIRTVSKRI